MGWRKLHAIWWIQGSRHIRILGNAFKIQYSGAIWSSAKKKDLQFYQTWSHAVVLYNTLPAACIVNAGSIKTMDELYQKVRLTSEVSRVVFKIELEIWSARSTKPRRKIIVGAIKRLENFRENLEQRRGPQNSLSFSFCSRAAEYNTREQSQEADREVRDPQAQRIAHSGLETDGKDQQVQQRIARLDRRHERQDALPCMRSK